MIKEISFEKTWITKSVADMKTRGVSADPLLIEKTVYALHLLEQISKLKFDFVFKGGTALILLLGEPTRFSIDIDIQTPPENNNEQLLELLQTIVGDGKPFIKVDENVRAPNGIPKRHFRFYYETIIAPGTNQYVLLDIVFEKPVYSETQKVKVKNILVDTCSPDCEVSCPTIQALLGDKMTAFAPNTTGISYDKVTEIIKQMFDVANLTDHIEIYTLEKVKENFKNCAYQNLTFRGLSKLTHEDVLKDILETSLIIFMNGKINEDVFKLLQSGIKKIKGYIHKENYHYDHAVRDAGKVANIALSLLNDSIEFEKFDKTKDYAFVVEPKYEKRLNQVKKSNKEAYFYWGRVLSSKAK